MYVMLVGLMRWRRMRVVIARRGKAVSGFVVDGASGSSKWAFMSDSGDTASPTSRPSEKLRVESVARAMPSSRREIHGISVSACTVATPLARRNAAVRYGRIFVATAIWRKMLLIAYQTYVSG